MTDIEEYREISQSSGHLDVVFVFVQAKRSASFEANTIGTFGFAVLDFFKEEPTLPRGGDVGKYAEIMEAIYEESAKFKNGSNPECHLYYVTTGKWSRDPALESRRTHVMNDLQCLAQFSAVEFHPVDAENIQILYQRTKSTASATFNFADCSVLPDMPGVTQAYIGFLPISEFFKLVMDDDDEIIRGLFYSNPRDWIGYNKINTEIKDTLESAARRARFALMNNGVTIIAGEIKRTGNKFHIDDYQIVNGCQTTNALADNRAQLDDKVAIPVRLIGTQDDDVTKSVVRATNQQTAVTDEQFYALEEFPKSLELSSAVTQNRPMVVT